MPTLSAVRHIRATGWKLTHIPVDQIDALTVSGHLPYNETWTVAGRAPTLHALLEGLVTEPYISNFLPETRERPVREGLRGNYRGHPLILISDFREEDDSVVWPVDELWLYDVWTQRGRVLIDRSLREYRLNELVTDVDYEKSAQVMLDILEHPPTG